MNVLPNAPPVFDRSDVEGTVRDIVKYLHSLQEDVDFFLGTLQRDGGLEQQELQELKGQIVNVGSQVGALAGRLEALRQDMEEGLGAMQEALDGQQEALDALDARVTALEERDETPAS